MSLVVGELVAYMDLDKSAYDRGVVAARGEMQGLAVELGRSLDDASTRSGRMVDEVAQAMGGVADTAAREGKAAGEAFADGIGTGSDGADRMVLDVHGKLQDAVPDIERAGEELGKATGDGAERGGHDAGGKLAQGIEQGFIRNSPMIVAAVAGALTLGAPAVIAGAGLMFAGVAAVALKSNADVAKSWSNLGGELKAGAAQDAAVLVPTFQAMAAQIGDAYEKLRPQMREAFADTRPLIDDVTDGVTQLATNAMPGLVRAVGSAEPVFSGLESMLSRTGTGLGDMLTNVSTHAPAAGTALDTIGRVIGDILPMVGDLVGEGAELASTVLPPIASGFHLVADGVHLVAPVLPTVVAGFLALKAMGAVSSLLGSAATSLTEMGAAGTVAAGGLRAVESAMGPIGLVLAVASAAYVALSGSQDKAAGSAGNLRSAMEATKGAIDDTVRAAAAKDLAQSGLLDWANKWGLQSSVVVDAALGVKGAMDQVSGGAMTYGQNLQESAKAGGIFAAGADEQSRASDKALGSLQKYAGQAADTASQQQKLADAAQATGTKLDTASTKADENSASLDAVSKSASSASKEIDGLKTSLDMLTGNYVSLVDAQAAVQAAVSKAKDALKDQAGAVLDGSGNFNAYTEAGRAAIDVVDGIRDKGSTLVATMEQQGATTDAVAKAQSGLRDSFIAAESQMGITGQAAQDLANKYLGVPGEVSTQINANTGPAQAAVAGIQAQINGVQQATPVVLSADTGQGKAIVDGFQAAIDNITQGKVPGVTADTMLGKLTIGEFQSDINAIRQGLPPGVTVNSDRGKLLVQQLQNAVDDIQQNRVPGLNVNTAAGFSAVLALQRQIDSLRDKSVTITTNTVTNSKVIYSQQGISAPGPGGGVRANATGGIMLPMADGGILPTQQSGTAGIYEPNDPTVLIGDNKQVPEAYIPMNSSMRSMAILTATAERMGYGLVPRTASRGPASAGAGGSTVPASSAVAATPAAPAPQYTVIAQFGSETLEATAVRVVDSRNNQLLSEIRQTARFGVRQP